MDRDFGDENSATASLHQYLSQELDEDWETVASNFIVRLSRGEQSLRGKIGTEAAIYIAQMLQETGRDYAHFIGLLPKKMAREVSLAIPD